MELTINFENLTNFEATKLLSSIGHIVKNLNQEREPDIFDSEILYSFEYSKNNPLVRETNTFTRYITKGEEKA